MRIAFIDSGISTKHIDPAHVDTGKNYVFPEGDTQDRIGHGTATAGMVLGASDQGVSGIFPDAVAIPLVVMDQYPTGVVKNGGVEALCEAIYDAVDTFECRIINISLAILEDREELRNAVNYAEAHGAVVVSVVGNDGEEGMTCYPAAYETVISVGSTAETVPASFSQRGADVLTDGANLIAVTNKNSMMPTIVSGTSYSAARISGVCAKLISAYPGLSPAEVRQGLFRLAADMLEPGFDVESGWGYVASNQAIPVPYLDIRTDSWMYSAILFVTEQHIMNGVGVAEFAPDAPMVRAMFTTVLYRLAGMPAVNAENSFIDVAEGQYYTDAVRWAAESGIAAGYGNGVFGTNDLITREQLVTLLWRSCGEPSQDDEALSAYSDTAQISEWALDAFAWAVGCGLIHGRGDGILAPQDTATRAETAQIIMNFRDEASTGK